MSRKSNISRTKRTDPRSETKIERDIRVVLDLFKIAYSKTNVARKRGKDGAFQATEGVRAGWPDYSALLPPFGQFFGIEVKREDGTVSDDQLLMKGKILRDGGIWLEARNADTVWRFLVDHFNEFHNHPAMTNRINFSPKQDAIYVDTNHQTT